MCNGNGNGHGSGSCICIDERERVLTAFLELTVGIRVFVLGKEYCLPKHSHLLPFLASFIPFLVDP